jgi:hypothetical protein
VSAKRKLADCDLVYTWTGKRAHVLRFGTGPSDGRAAECSLFPMWGTYWYGTGTQAEWERARALPLCKRCAEHVDAVQ